VTLPFPAGLVALLATVAALGVAAAVDAARAWASARPESVGAAFVLAVPAATGVATAGSALRWLIIFISPAVERRVRGGRTVAAYFAWILWTICFSALSVKLGSALGRPAGLALGALTARIAASRLDLLPRIVVFRGRVLGPGLATLAFGDLEAFEVVEGAAPGLACVRFLRRGASGPVDEWIAAGEAQAMRRELSARGLRHRERLSPRAARPPPV
jgi:hypothetical protein